MNNPNTNISGPMGVPFRFDSVPLLWTVKNVYSAEECENFIQLVELLQPDTDKNNPYFIDRDRYTIDDAVLADQLLERIRDKLPNRIGNLNLNRINERFRFYRYKPGHKFIPHMDHWYNPNDKEISLFTILAYFNSDFEGGETRFMEQMEETVRPEPGLVAIFQHKVRHEGCVVRCGTKYAVRTDVIYSLVSPAGR